ncbi:unnamed protein product [Heterobilharzia americana]|nr:unnamed protein product [Heterobilharzia americana]CAH8573511.1 unnamed protein product [Heterobilharzia americana]
MLLVSKLSKCQDYHRRHSKRSLCKNTIHDEMNSCMNNSNEILSSNNQIIQHMNSDELEWCRRATEDLYNHESSWAFRKPVNHKQVPIYRKIIKHPIDLSTIRRKVQDAGAYSSFNNWVQDVRLMFSNCEVFNEDDSDVGRAGHIMRAYFECHWSKFNEGINANVHEKDEVMINNVNEEVITNYKNSSDIEECSGN